MQEQAIAIVAMAGVFPDAPSVDALWANLLAGHESGREFTVDELVAAGVPADIAARADFVRRRPVIDRCDEFDAAFFGFSPLEAEALDPQLRLLMQCAYHALEESGSTSSARRLRAGLFAGIRESRYLNEHLMASERHTRSLGGDYLQMINRKDSAATLLAYKLDLGGPAVSVNTACSTSLLAVHLACSSLLAYECDVALAGGAAISSFGPDGVTYVPGGILSRDGRCRPFSDDADGTIDGAGVAVVGLKRLADAMQDGDRIHAVILASAVNNDGADKAGYTAPSVAGQARVIADALALADISPETIGYVEAHGTGTRLGDPIEVRALTQAWRRFGDRRGYCRLGSIKANVGHLGAAAGVAGLIKAALVVRDGRIPALVNFTRPNSELDLASTPFVIPTSTTDWPAQESPRRAAISSFGIGGTNAHAILEQPPQAPRSDDVAAADDWHLCALSARSAAAFQATAASMATGLAARPDARPDALAATLAAGRAHLPWRGFAVVQDAGQLAVAWRAAAAPLAPARARSRVAFLFPGQGSQHRGMTLALRARWPAFREAFDATAALVLRHGDIDLVAALTSSGAEDLTRTDVAQPALFATSVALASAWKAVGVEPEALLGHSVGELAAACVAGVFTLDEAVRLVCARGRLMQAAERGAMLAVPLEAAALASRLGPDLEIAAINGRTSCVASGPVPAIERLHAELAAEGIQVRLLHTSHAFHSASMREPARGLADVVRTLSPRAPAIAVVSNVTGEWLTAEQAVSPDYWARQLREPVQFERGLQALQARGIEALLEVGPGTTLSSLARGELPQATVVASQPHPATLDKTTRPEDRAFLQAAGQLWAIGVPVDLDALAPRPAGGSRQHLAGYVFDKVRHWVDASPAGGIAARPTTPLRRVELVPLATGRPGERAGSVRLEADGPPALAALAAHPAGAGLAVRVRHSPQPVEEALLALQSDGVPDAQRFIAADFEAARNVDALQRLLAALPASSVVVLLEGRAFGLALREPAGGPSPAIAPGELAGLSGESGTLLRAHAEAADAARPLNLAWLTGAAADIAGHLGRIGASAGPWILIDSDDLAPAERLSRLLSARAHLRAAGVLDTAWVAARGALDRMPPRALLDLLSALAEGDGALHAADLRPILPDTEPSPETTMTDEITSPASDAGDVRGSIRAIWAKVLGTPVVGLDDNFFDLGGNSLWALQIVSQVNEAFGCEIHLSELLNAATVNELAALVEKRLLSVVDDGELGALLDELGDLSDEDIARLLAEPGDGGAAAAAAAAEPV